MDFFCRVLTDVSKGRIAQIEITKQVPVDGIPERVDEEIRAEVHEAVRSGLSGLPMPESLQAELTKWSALVADLESRATALRDEQTDLFHRQNDLWKNGGASAATLEALDGEERRLRDLYQAIQEHVGNASEKLGLAKDALVKSMRQEARKIATAHVQLTQAEQKALEGLEAFLAKNQAILVECCRKRLAGHLYRNHPDSWLGAVEGLGQLRAQALLETEVNQEVPV